MKRVGLITYYGNNYGGVLQAYALQQVVAAFGYDCALISNDFLYKKKSANRAKAILVNLRSALKDPATYLKKRNIYKTYAAQTAQKAAMFAAFREKNLRIDVTGYKTYEAYQENPPQYDVYLCGSDQIWNPNLYSDNGFYFADFAPDAALRVAYASSMGVSSLTEQQIAFVAPLLKKIQIISAREQSCAQIVREIAHKNARVVLDPTLLLDAAKWATIAAPRQFPEPYVFCYLFGERDYYEAVKKRIQEITGMRMVCIPFVPRELSSSDAKVFDAGPPDFIGLIQHASLVVTDSFHATAFSLNFKVPFVSLCRFQKNDRKSMNDRLISLLDLVGLQDRLIDETDSLSSAALLDVDFEKAHAILNQKREQDRRFLYLALNGKEETEHEDL